MLASEIHTIQKDRSIIYKWYIIIYKNQKGAMVDNIPKEYRALCAKTHRKRKDKWLPLWMHLTDTAEVMEYLCTHWLADSTKHSIGLGGTEDIVRFGRFIGMTHDIAKGTALFQYKITSGNAALKEKLKEAGWKIRADKLTMDTSGHALAGDQILSSLGVSDSAAAIVGTHHGKPPSFADRDDMKAYPCNYRSAKEDAGQWTGFWGFWLNHALTSSGYESVSDIPDVSKAAQTVLSGLLSMADWIASNTSYFPLADIDQDPKEDVYPLRAETGLRRFNLPLKSRFSKIIQTKSDFYARFGFSPNIMQAAVLEVACTCRSPGILIIEAQMGNGKTEAALAAAEIFSLKAGTNGLFYGLPTQATADGIFPRLLQWGQDISKDSTHTVRLVHGSAALNEDYTSLKVVGDPTEAEACDGHDEHLVVHEWFTGKKQALLSDYIVGTIDQILMSALKQKYVTLRHLGIAGKTVIIDECHAYDAYTNEYLKETLKWLGAHGVPVILLSATLPAAKRKELIASYVGPKKAKNMPADTCSYPLLTWSDGGEVFQKAVSLEDTRRLNVKIHWDSDEALKDSVRDAIKEGGCAGIIVNTVKRAQKLYESLSAEIEDAVIILCHAQMVVPDRLEKERLLTAHTGKRSQKKDRDRVIVIGTSVLEQSLDIDFDILYTDLCPMDLLLQRIGRLHRHMHHDAMRPEALKTPSCHILCGDGTALEKGACSIYGEYLLMKTKALVPDTITLPDSIPELVQPVYDDNDSLGLSGTVYEKAKERSHINSVNKRQKAGAYKFKAPRIHGRYSPTDTIRGALDGTIEAAGLEAEAVVRDGEDSVEVLVFRKDRNGDICYLPWQNEGACIPALCVPSEEECRKIARQKLRLPHRLCHGGIINQTLAELGRTYRLWFSAWEDSSWLRSELVLLLDDKLEAELCGIHIKYTKDEGLLFVTKKENYERD